MAAETNLIKKADLAKAREVEFTLMFNESVKKLVEALGVTRKIPKQAGATLKTYKATGTLADGEVDEGETIPLSKYKTEAITWAEITLKKWRKATSAEAIVERGYEQAVEMTTDRMLKDVQKAVRADFFAFLADAGADKIDDSEGSVTGTPSKHYTTGTLASGTGLQAALANAWGKLQILFEDDDVEAVYFINPLDVATYLGSASITTQNAFGMSYIENFLGLGTVIMNSSVPQGKFYATAKENLVLYYIPVNGADLSEAFSFTSDATGYIGIHEVPDYTNMTASDVVVSGLTIFAERIDGVVVGTIS